MTAVLPIGRHFQSLKQFKKRVNFDIVYLFTVVLVASAPSSSGSGDFYKGPLYHHVPASFARSSGASGLEEKTTRRMVRIFMY
jgi:hypothetical protein